MHIFKRASLSLGISLQDYKWHKLFRILLGLKKVSLSWGKSMASNLGGGKGLHLPKLKVDYCTSSHRNSKIDNNYLKELNEDLKLRKQELLEILKPLEDKNTLLFQKLMANLEEKQRRYASLLSILKTERLENAITID